LSVTVPKGDAPPLPADAVTGGGGLKQPV